MFESLDELPLHCTWDFETYSKLSTCHSQGLWSWRTEKIFQGLWYEILAQKIYLLLGKLIWSYDLSCDRTQTERVMQYFRFNGRIYWKRKLKGIFEGKKILECVYLKFMTFTSKLQALKIYYLCVVDQLNQELCSVFSVKCYILWVEGINNSNTSKLLLLS